MQVKELIQSLLEVDLESEVILKDKEGNVVHDITLFAKKKEDYYVLLG